MESVRNSILGLFVILCFSNMLSGYAEKEHISDFAFETQRKTYHSYGYAQDPSKPLDEEDMHREEKQVVSR